MAENLDPQQNKVYDAQRYVFRDEDEVSILDLQAWVNSVVADPWFRARYPHVKALDVRDGRGVRDAQTSKDGVGMLMPKGTRYPYIALHETTHIIDTSGGEDHGPVFCGLFLFLVGRSYDLNRKARLAYHFKKHGVRWDHKIAKYGNP